MIVFEYILIVTYLVKHLFVFFLFLVSSFFSFFQQMLPLNKVLLNIFFQLKMVYNRIHFVLFHVFPTSVPFVPFCMFPFLFCPWDGLQSKWCSEKQKTRDCLAIAGFRNCFSYQHFVPAMPEKWDWHPRMAIQPLTGADISLTIVFNMF